MGLPAQQGILKRHRLKSGNERPLTMKQLLFIDAYLETQNGTESARRAGYKGNDNVLNQQAMDNLRNPTIARRVSQRLAPIIKRSKMSADQVLEELSDIAASDWRDHLQIKMKDGEVIDAQLKLGDKVKALEIMAKYHGLLQADRPNQNAVNERRQYFLSCIEFVKRCLEESGQPVPPDKVIYSNISRSHPDVRDVMPEWFEDPA